MELQVDERRLKEMMSQRGFDNYEVLAEEAKRRGKEVHWRTIYNFAKGANWTRGTLEAVCLALDCQPSDLVPALTCEKDQPYTHVAPDTAKEPEGATV